MLEPKTGSDTGSVIKGSFRHFSYFLLTPGGRHTSKELTIFSSRVLLPIILASIASLVLFPCLHESQSGTTECGANASLSHWGRTDPLVSVSHSSDLIGHVH